MSVLVAHSLSGARAILWPKSPSRLPAAWCCVSLPVVVVVAAAASTALGVAASAASTRPSATAAAGANFTVTCCAMGSRDGA